MTDQQKTVAVVIPAGDGETDTTLQEVTIIPGITTQDVLNSLNRGTGFILGNVSGNLFRPRDLLFDLLEANEKLWLTPSAEAGAKAPAHSQQRPDSLFGRLRRLVTTPTTTPMATPAKRIVAEVSAPVKGNRQVVVASPGRSAPIATPRKPIHALLNIKPAWQEKGWKEVSPGIYQGNFKCPFGSFKGRVEFAGQRFRRSFIWGPPAELWRSRHPKAVCFSREGEGKYQVHMYDTPTSVDSAILNIERILNEVFVLGGK